MSRANNKVSTVLENQLPFFIKEDHPKFAEFLKKYYKFMEQPESNFRAGNPVERILHHLENIDVDNTNHDEAAQYLYNKFIEDIPISVQADRAILLKNIKDFYRAKGTEKATKFLIYALTGFANTEVYYPKRDILKTSDGKWYVQKSIRVSSTAIDSVSNSDIGVLNLFTGRRITGNSSNASALVESAERFYLSGSRVDELIISNIDGTFENGEIIRASYIQDGGSLGLLTGQVFGGSIESITITNGGSQYEIGDPVAINASQGNGASAIVSAVSTGNVSSIVVRYGGSGFQVGDPVTITGFYTTPANAYVSAVDTTGDFHANSYNVAISRPALEANTPVGNAVYSNLVPALSDPANSAVANSMTYFTYANTGPITVITVDDPGSGFTSPPSLEVVSNTTIRSIGILGRIKINEGGSLYHVGDELSFSGGIGVGAKANVTTVNATGAITKVTYHEQEGFPKGGWGYTSGDLPTISITSNTGTGANLTVSSILGDGEELLTANSTVGAVEAITVLDGGFGYENVSLSLALSGDGNATATAVVIGGVYTYPGRFLNDDGFLSSYNFIQDRDFYQLFSYVLKTGVSSSEYEKEYLTLGHPAGMKLFAEYQQNNNDVPIETNLNNISNETMVDVSGAYSGTSEDLILFMASHGRVANDRIFVSFTSGNFANTFADGKYYKVESVVNSDLIKVVSEESLIQYLDNAPETIEPEKTFFNDSGTILFLINNNRVVQYSLTRPFDILSATFEREKTFGDTLTSLMFTDTGNTLYVLENTNKIIRQYSMSSWNVATTSLQYSLNVASQVSDPQSFYIEDGGEFLFVTDTATGNMISYLMSTKWRVSTGTYKSSTNIATFETETMTTDVPAMANNYYYTVGDTITLIPEDDHVVSGYHTSVGTYSGYIII